MLKIEIANFYCYDFNFELDDYANSTLRQFGSEVIYTYMKFSRRIGKGN